MIVPEEFRESSGEPWLLSRSVTHDEASLLSAIRDDDHAVSVAELIIAESWESQLETQDARERQELAHSLS